MQEVELQPFRLSRLTTTPIAIADKGFTIAMALFTSRIFYNAHRGSSYASLFFLEALAFHFSRPF